MFTHLTNYFQLLFENISIKINENGLGIEHVQYKVRSKDYLSNSSAILNGNGL